MAPETKYLWQQTVIDAYTAPAHLLNSKIASARRAIADRLNRQPEPDTEEEIAIQDALNALRVLASPMTPAAVRPEEKKNKDIA